MDIGDLRGLSLVPAGCCNFGLCQRLLLSKDWCHDNLSTTAPKEGRRLSGAPERRSRSATQERLKGSDVVREQGALRESPISASSDFKTESLRHRLAQSRRSPKYKLPASRRGSMTDEDASTAVRKQCRFSSPSNSSSDSVPLVARWRAPNLPPRRNVKSSIGSRRWSFADDRLSGVCRTARPQFESLCPGGSYHREFVPRQRSAKCARH